jgi:hypothetical protein
MDLTPWENVLVILTFKGPVLWVTGVVEIQDSDGKINFYYASFVRPAGDAGIKIRLLDENGPGALMPLINVLLC